MSEYLPSNELYDLTGYAHTSKQIIWLAEQGIPYLLDNRNRLVVSREHVRGRLEGRTVVRSSGLNLAAIK